MSSFWILGGLNLSIMLTLTSLGLLLSQCVDYDSCEPVFTYESFNPSEHSFVLPLHLLPSWHLSCCTTPCVKILHCFLNFNSTLEEIPSLPF